MRHATVDEMRPPCVPTTRDVEIESGITRLTHSQAYQFALELRLYDAGWCLERKLVWRCRSTLRESRKTPRTIAAHLGFAPVAVVIAHPEIRTVRRRLQKQNTISADAPMTVANLGNLCFSEPELVS